MRFLERALVESPLLLLGVGIALYAANLALYVATERRRREVPALYSEPAQPLKTRLFATLVGATIFLGAGLLASGEARALFGGAFVVMQLAGIATLLGTLQTLDALRRPGAFAGWIATPHATQARIQAGTMLSLALFALGGFALTGSPSFFGASLFLAATSLGYRRRAAIYARRAAAVPSPPAASS